jgi:hypothetical protein
LPTANGAISLATEASGAAGLPEHGSGGASDLARLQDVQDLLLLRVVITEPALSVQFLGRMPTLLEVELSDGAVLHAARHDYTASIQPVQLGGGAAETVASRGRF